MSGFTLNFCPQCGSKLQEQAKFCSQCGLQLGEVGRLPAGYPAQRRSITPKQYAYIGLLALIIWLPAWQFQSWQGGKRPTQTFEQPVSAPVEEAPEHDPEIAKLDAAAKSKPADLEAQQALASALVTKIRQSETPSNQLVFSAMEALTAVLKLSPKDPDALIAMADISFNQQVFGKAADFYSRYLGVEPNDNGARARYASSLSFAGKFDDALKELNSVLEKDPSNFNASAYLAVTYAQMGKKGEAVTAGEKALKLAPNDDARARFAQFLDEVKNASTAPEGQQNQPEMKSPSTPPLATGHSAEAPVPAETGSPVAILTDFVRKNPIAGPKFVDAEDKGNGTIALYFRNFPMAGMPPFVKDKFVNSIKFKAMDLGVQTILFMDKDTSEEMVKTLVKGNS